MASKRSSVQRVRFDRLVAEADTCSTATTRPPTARVVARSGAVGVDEPGAARRRSAARTRAEEAWATRRRDSSARDRAAAVATRPSRTRSIASSPLDTAPAVRPARPAPCRLRHQTNGGADRLEMEAHSRRADGRGGQCVRRHEHHARQTVRRQASARSASASRRAARALAVRSDVAHRCDVPISGAASGVENRRATVR